jgi:WASH complex subunit FAM21
MAEAGAEKVINYDDLKAGTPKWSLHDDHALLKTLQTMSINLHVQTKKLEDNVSDLVNESTSTDVRLQNTFNEFLSLANTQFIENRVYQDEVGGGKEDGDEDDTAAGAGAGGAPVTESELLGTFKGALNGGMDALRMFTLVQYDESGQEVPDELNVELEPDVYNEQVSPRLYIWKDPSCPRLRSCRGACMARVVAILLLGLSWSLSRPLSFPG